MTEKSFNLRKALELKFFLYYLRNSDYVNSAFCHFPSGYLTGYTHAH